MTSGLVKRAGAPPPDPLRSLETAPFCGTFYGMPEAPAATWTSRPGKARLPHPSVLCPTRLPGGSVGCHQPVACTEGVRSAPA